MNQYLRRLINRITNRSPVTAPVAPGEDDYPLSYTGTISSLGLTAGANLVIPAGEDWLLDTDTPALGSASIAGSLWVDTTKSTSFTAKYVNVTSTGKYQCGKPTARLPKAYTHVIECNNTEQGRAVAYTTWQTASSGGSGTLKAIWEGAGIDRAETYTVAFTSASAFTVTGSSSGALGSGTVGTAFNTKIHFVATGTFANGNTRTLISQAKAFNNTGLTSRGFIVDEGGSIKLFGHEKTHRCRLEQTSGNTFAAGATGLLTDIVPSEWDIGDTVVIGTTEHYQWGNDGTNNLAQCDSRTLSASMTDKNMYITSGLSRARWARMQYINQTADDAYGRDQGAMSVTDTGYTTHHSNTPTTIDQRAWVANLTRNIVFQGPDDAAWQNVDLTGRLGAHMMFMGLSEKKIKLDHVEFKRCGQRGRHGRYPIHFHMNSYEMPYGSGKPSNGVSKGAFVDTYLRGVTVNFSAQHGIQLHGCMGVEVTNCATYNVTGHAFNLEDGSELNNSFTDCIAMQTVDSGTSTTLQLRGHESEASGFWLTNPGNDISGCVSVRATHGIWLSPAEACFGLSRDIAVRPSRVMHGVMENNYTITTRTQGVITGHIVGDELGNVTGGTGYYWPVDADGVTLIFTLTGYQIYKSGSDSYTNRGGYPRYVNFIVADGARTDFSGSITVGKIVNSLIVNYSANVTPISRNGVVYTSNLPTRRGMASYHYTLVPDGCCFIGFGASFPAAPVTNWTLFNPDGKISGIEATSGAIGSDDLYIKPIEMGFIQIVNNKFMSCAVCPFSRTWDFRIKYTGETNTNLSTSVAGAKWDPAGLWGTAGHYAVFDDPVYTYGVTTYPIPDDPYSVRVDQATCLPYGIKVYLNDKDTAAYNTAQVGVNSARLMSYTTYRLDSGGATIGTWNVGKRDNVALLKDSIMIPAVKGGKFNTVFQAASPDRRPTTLLSWSIDNANRGTDWCIIGMDWRGANAHPRVYKVCGTRTNADEATAAELAAGQAATYSDSGITSLALLEASAGNTFWYDVANGRIWFKYIGGLNRVETMGDPEKDFDEWQYQQSVTTFIKNT